MISKPKPNHPNRRVQENQDQKSHAKFVRSNLIVLITVFFDYHGVLFIPQGHTVNKEYYLKVMRRFRKSIRKKRAEMWKENSWILHHDNAPAHKSLLVSIFLVKNSTSIMPEPPYSLNLTTCDFFLFPKLKRLMKGRRFATIEEIKAASLAKLMALPKRSFQKCFNDWKKR